MADESVYHEGELSVQRRAGVTDEARRLSRMLSSPHLRGGFSRFLRDRDFVVISALDCNGLIWASPLFAAPGFLDGQDRRLLIHAAPPPGDPLAGLPAPQAMGMIAIEFATRSRVRVNGTLLKAGHDELEVEVAQAYGNCPQYIARRDLRPDKEVITRVADRVTWTSFAPEHIALITAADTFFLGTEHPTRGADASHRGGRPGFVRADGDDLWWPDYPGNNMFNSLGNLVVNPIAGLLFVDFQTGETLHLTGRATVEWREPGSPGDDGYTGRRTRFTPELIVRGAPLHLHAAGVELSGYDPPLT
jgi:hypothetical protein